MAKVTKSSEAVIKYDALFKIFWLLWHYIFKFKHEKSKEKDNVQFIDFTDVGCGWKIIFIWDFMSLNVLEKLWNEEQVTIINDAKLPRIKHFWARLPDWNNYYIKWHRI